MTFLPAHLTLFDQHFRQLSKSALGCRTWATVEQVQTASIVLYSIIHALSWLSGHLRTISWLAKQTLWATLYLALDFFLLFKMALEKKNEEGFGFFGNLGFERFALSMHSIFCCWNFSLTIFAYRCRSLSQTTYILHLLHMIDLFSFYLFYLFAI
jgi:hypothetical protein